MNYQGRLTNTWGQSVADGNYNITFRIFDAATGGSEVWNEKQKVTVSGGLFNVLLGSGNPLTPAMFNGTTRFLEVQVSGDPAMTPRQRLASVAYAMNGVPSGAVSFFEATSCPSGWSQYGAASGRVVVGLPAGGTVAGTVGSALSNLGLRLINDVPSHTHYVNDPGHSHYLEKRTGDDPNANPGLMGGSFYEGWGTYGAYTGITIKPTGSAAVDVTMPYVQLLACKKQ